MTTLPVSAAEIAIRRARAGDVARIAELIMLGAATQTMTPEAIREEQVAHSNRVSDRFASMISDGIAEGSIRPVDPAIAAQMLNATLNAGAELGFWVPGVTQKQAASIFARPLLMGVFAR